MKATRRTTAIIPAATWALVFVLTPGCGDRHQTDHHHEKAHDDRDTADHHVEYDQKDLEGHEGHEGHGHVSDLDRPVAELFEASCEHQIKTHTCEECRYEVGVVRASQDLFDAGLLKTTRAEERRMAVPLSLTGEVQFDDRRVAHVRTLSEGLIRQVQVTLGDRVKKGDPLATIESVSVGEAQGAYLEAQGMLSLAEKNHQRAIRLKEEGISSEKEFAASSQALETARIRAESARGTLKRLGMKAPGAGAKSQGRIVLRAPSDGTVLDMHAVVGEIAKSEEPLFTVGDSGTLWVWADLYERDLGRVARAQAVKPLDAEITVKAYPDEAFRGVVDFISPAMSRASRTVKVRVALPNPDGRLLAGMFAGVRIFVPSDDTGLTLPTSAILEDEGRAFVFVHHKDDYYVRRPVTPGQVFGGYTEIKGGLKGDETVVTDGAFLLKSDVLRSKMGAGCAD
jgi:cobalt-zinc-cadmium efflux system membrane fusion protein